MYTEGIGVDQNDEEAAKWYRITAEDGDVSAQLLRGKMYLEGRGLSQSAESAYAWWLVAAAKSNKTAKQKRVAIEANLTPEQIEKAQHLAIGILLTLGE